MMEVTSIKSKSDIATSDFEVMVTLTQPKFNEITIVITCGSRNIFIVAEGNHPYCWACGATGHLAKLCPQWFWGMD